ncbi:MAG: FeoB-associated Cys-rich membrane protein [Clostridia bacterium]|nr:FeoB-associated Cys-rich membrane protein [Clostridia bacterium]
MLGEIIAITAIVLIIGGATWYIIKAKKSGRKCIGCPDGCSCGVKDGKKAPCEGKTSCEGGESCCCQHKEN